VAKTPIVRAATPRNIGLFPVGMVPAVTEGKSPRGVTVRQAYILILASATLAGCVNVTVIDSRDTSRTRSLPAFDKVQASRGIDVTLRCGSTPSAVLHGDDDDIADTELSVEDGVLTARRSTMIGGYHRTVHAEVTTPGPIVKLSAASGATLDAPSCLITHDRLEVDASSGASIHLAGEVRRLVADAGSGSAIRPLKGDRIDAGEADVDAGSGSVVRLCAVGTMRASASTGADITTESVGAGDRSSSFGGGYSLKKCE
jgi:hypothetical protein